MKTGMNGLLPLGLVLALCAACGAPVDAASDGTPLSGGSEAAMVNELPPPGSGPAARPSPAQQEAMDAYAASQSSEADRVGAAVESSFVADLDGDGTPEVVAEINWFSGNSSFGRLVVFVETGNGLRKVAQSEDPLGMVQRISIEDGLIQVESLWAGPNDARCCPSLEKTTSYRWQGDKVVEVVAGSAAAATR